MGEATECYGEWGGFAEIDNYAQKIIMTTRVTNREKRKVIIVNSGC